MNCTHKNFETTTKVTRLTAGDLSEEITGYQADIRIFCADCGLPFQFRGVPAGISLEKPAANFDWTEMSVPIMPHVDPVQHVKTFLK